MAKPRRKAEWQSAARDLGLADGGTVPQIKQRIAEFSYNAVEDKSRRQPPAKYIKHESCELTLPKRRKLNATTQDQARNHSLMAWMIRNHLDYVSEFHVSVNTGNDVIDRLISRILRWHGAPRNFDVAGRMGRDEMFRLFESEKVMNGDCGLIKLPELKLQGLESDLIAKGTYEGDESVNDFGLVVDEDTGARKKFSVCTRQTIGNKPVFHHLEDAANVIFDGYWTRLTSQYRGVSPLASALNSIQDIAEGFEFNQLKAKMHALFGLAIMRQTADTGAWGGAGGATAETASASATAADTELDLNPRAVNLLDLNPGDDVKVIESGTPSTEFVEGSYLFIQIAMLALDMPVTMFDVRKGSFSHVIADLNKYEKSCQWKQTKNRYVRQEYSDWLIRSIYNDSQSDWPLQSVARKQGFSLRDLQEAVVWVCSGSPWLQKLQQLQGDKLGIEIGIDNPIDAARRRGQDVFANIDKTAQVYEYAAAKNVPLLYGSSGQKSIEEIAADAVAAAKEADAANEVTE